MYKQSLIGHLLVSIFLLLLVPPVLSQNNASPVYFTLDKGANTSAGIYTSEGKLIRTLWSGINYSAGKYEIKWDGTDDSGELVSHGDFHAKILSNNVQYQWEGVIGNTSDSMSGSTKYHSYDIINCMAITKGLAYCGAGYQEGNTSQIKVDLSKPQQKSLILPLDHSTSQSTYFATTDGTYVFWAGYDPFAPSKNFVFATKTSNDTEATFPAGVPLKATYGRSYLSVIDYLNDSQGIVTGLAISGNYLFVSHGKMNLIHVLNKSTGALVQTITRLINPKAMAADSSGHLWVITGGTLAKYNVNPDGTLTLPTLSLAGLVAPVSMAVSPDGNTIVVCDAGTSQQLKAFSNTSGAISWNFGAQGGYASDPIVSNDKFYFSDLTNDIGNTFICFQPDGSFWVSDPGNYRVQHFTANREFVERIMYLPVNYSVQVDENNPGRLFAEYLEFAVDYSKALAPDNGSWKLVRNWRGSITLDYHDSFTRDVFKNIKTLSNGRTYGTIRRNSTGGLPVLVELTPEGSVRLTGINFAENETLNADGSVTTISQNSNDQATSELTFRKRVLMNFNSSNDPVWESSVVLATTQMVNGDPDFGGAYTKPVSLTSTGVVVSFSANIPDDGRRGYHLGGLLVGSSEWLWKTALSTHSSYKGAFPTNGDFDIGNGVAYAGNAALAIGRNIFWGYNGEFWKQSQTNKWNHVYDNGLFIGQFGTTGPEVAGQEAPKMMAGNSFSPAIVKVGEDYYLYHNDESYHGGVHRWKITGLNTIQEQSISLTNYFNNSIEKPNLPGIDLMKGLPFDAVVLDNTAGWSRSHKDEDYTNYDQYWSVKTNVKTYSKRKSPDIWISYSQAEGPYSITRDLETLSDLSSWTLSGQISFEGNMPNTDVNSMYLDVLDYSGKILARFYTTVTFDDAYTYNIFANDVLIASGSRNSMEKVTGIFQLLSISMSGGSIVVKYADYAPVVISSLDPVGNINRPKSMRLYFDYLRPGNIYSKIIGLDEFRFIEDNQKSVEVAATGVPMYRINAGGGQMLTSSGIFNADNFYSPSPGDIFGTVLPISGTVDQALYQSERNSSSLKLSYNFSVTPGKYRTVLYFAEIYHTEVAKRLFDVFIEGSKMLDDYDIVKKVGISAATSESFEVNVTDSILSIDLSSLASDGGRDRPKISAIEILSHSDNHAPRSHAGSDESITLPIDSSTLHGTGSDDDGTISGYQWSQISGPNDAVFNNTALASPTISGLTDGSYVFNLVVMDNEHFPSLGDQVTITVNQVSALGTPIYRINAGGSQISSSKGIFYADNYYLPFSSESFSTTTAIRGSGESSIYQSERNGTSGEFGYAFPVSNGSYTVILHFAEIYFTSIGSRIFDVIIEGTKVLDDFDIVKEAGSFAAVNKTFGLNVTDGKINIDFNSLAAFGGRNRPKISAIEILSNSDNQPPTSAAGDDKTITMPTNSVILNGAGTDSDGTITNYTWAQVSGPSQAVFSDNTLAQPTVSGLVAGSYIFNLTVRDNSQFPSIPDEVIITVNPLPITGKVIYRINAGGPQLSCSLGIFSADTFFSPTPGETYFSTASIVSTEDDAIYKSERNASSGTMDYSLPVSNGSYTVVLHFAEIYFTAPNYRVFDVSIEGTKVLDDYDIVKKVGSFTATTEVFTVNVIDDLLNICFSSLASVGGRNRAKISAIEVFQNSETSSINTARPALEIRSVNDKELKLSATISPNPSNNYFNLSISGKNLAVEITIFNVSGQLVETKRNWSSGNTLRLGSDYRSGLYYAVIKQGNERLILRFTKQ